jgi:chromosome segregation ATPase
MGLAASQWINILQSHLNTANRADQNAQHTDEKITNKKEDLVDIFKNMSDELENLRSLDDDMEAILKEDPRDKMYCGIGEFVDESNMCMMGMGMGQIGYDNDIKLTGRELAALHDLLHNKGKSYPVDQLCQLVEDLKSYGIDNAKVENGSLVLTRPDGTQQKIVDANGDGTISGCDYDFSAALEKFSADLADFEKKVKDIEDKIKVGEENLEDLEQKEEDTKDEIKYMEVERNNYEEAKMAAMQDYANGIIHMSGIDARIEHYLQTWTELVPIESVIEAVNSANADRIEEAQEKIVAEAVANDEAKAEARAESEAKAEVRAEAKAEEEAIVIAKAEEAAIAEDVDVEDPLLKKKTVV